MIEHEIFPEGESTAKWAFREPGFMGSSRQLTHCARCGGSPVQPRDKPRHCMDIFKPSMHFVCDECFDVLPE
jgi:hypothetical protein